MQTIKSIFKNVKTYKVVKTIGISYFVLYLINTLFFYGQFIYATPFFTTSLGSFLHLILVCLYFWYTGKFEQPVKKVPALAKVFYILLAVLVVFAPWIGQNIF